MRALLSARTVFSQQKLLGVVSVGVRYITLCLTANVHASELQLCSIVMRTGFIHFLSSRRVCIEILEVRSCMSACMPNLPRPDEDAKRGNDMTVSA